MEQQSKSVTITLDMNQLNVVMSGIAKLTIESGIETFNVIQQQAQQQLNAPARESEPFPGGENSPPTP